MARSNLVRKEDAQTGEEMIVDLTQVVGDVDVSGVEEAGISDEEIAEAGLSIVDAAPLPKQGFDASKYMNMNVSGKIRALAADGYTRSQTVKIFKEHFGRDILYQHVRNVLVQHAKRPAQTV